MAGGQTELKALREALDLERATLASQVRSCTRLSWGKKGFAATSFSCLNRPARAPLAFRALRPLQIREHRSVEVQMEAELRSLELENDSLHQQVSKLQRGREEGNEVVDALRSQLVDYRQLVTLVRR